MEETNWESLPYSLSQSRGYITMPVLLDRSVMRQNLLIRGTTLSLKTAFHVSLVRLKSFAEEMQRAVITEFLAFVKHAPMTDLAFNQEHRLVRRGDKATVITMCKVKNLNSFYFELSKSLDVDVEPPPTHITLYCNYEEEGIGVSSQTELEGLTEVVTDDLDLRVVLASRSTNGG